MQALTLFLLLTPCAAELEADREKIKRSIDFEEAQIKALEEELAGGSGAPKVNVLRTQDAIPAKKDGVTLLISVNEDDAEQIPIRLPHLIKAQNSEFSGGKWLVYDNNGVKPSLSMRQVMEKAMENKEIDGWMEVDYGQEAISNLYNKVGMRFATSTPTGNLAHYWMMDQCETDYCAHFDLSVAAHAKDGYSWVDSAKEVLKHNTQLVQVTSSIPSKQGSQAASLLETASGVQFKEISTNCQQVMSEARNSKGSRFITGRMYLMDKQRYGQLLPLNGAACKDSTLRWEESVSCEACRFNFRRASLNEGHKGWHLEFPAPAGTELANALNLVERGVAVTSKLLPHRAAALELWSMEEDFQALHPSEE